MWPELAAASPRPMGNQVADMWLLGMVVGKMVRCALLPDANDPKQDDTYRMRLDLLAAVGWVTIEK